jgi:hypothetical protein
MRLFLVIAALFVIIAAPARAATSVYVDSSHPDYAGFPDAVNSNSSLGAPNGISAFVPLGGFIAYLVNPTFTDVNLDIEFLGVTGAGTLRLYVGQTNGGTGFTALSSTFFTVTNGFNNLSSAALTSYCSGLGGCDTFIVQAWTGTTFDIDSVNLLGVNPEPSTWALMILAFVGVAWRMKAMRGRGALRAALKPSFA